MSKTIQPKRDWRIKDQDGVLLIVDSDDYQVCSVGAKHITGVPQDAALIMTAPKLLKALIGLLEYTGGGDAPKDHPCAIARAAVAEAVGDA